MLEYPSADKGAQFSQRDGVKPHDDHIPAI